MVAAGAHARVSRRRRPDFGADQGVAAALVYGVRVLVASLPGAAVLVTEWLPGQRRKLESAGPPWWRPSAVAGPQGAGRG